MIKISFLIFEKNFENLFFKTFFNIFFHKTKTIIYLYTFNSDERLWFLNFQQFSNVNNFVEKKIFQRFF